MRHSPGAVSNYVSTFTRVAQLAERRMSVPQIAFLLDRSRSLITSYLELLSKAREDENSRYHLEQLLTFGKPPSVRGQKKRPKQGVR
jgi:predicted transcriptional regulator